MEALVHAQRNGRLPHETVVVVSDKSAALGLERAERLGVPAVVVEHVDNGRRLTRDEHEIKLLTALEEYDVELIVLSGYMRLLSSTFLKHWPHRVVNIHPSLLPLFPGAHAHRDVLESGVSVSGCTVHMVDEGMDSGARLAQCPVPVFSDDTEATLAARIKIEEHRLYPMVLTWIAEGRVHLNEDDLEVEGVEDRLVH
jgi:phosphoribosylglycinamide formyltransferase-1